MDGRLNGINITAQSAFFIDMINSLAYNGSNKIREVTE